MRIRPYHFYIENFRNFRDTSFDLGRKITVVSGQNGVGKSNILSLIASSSGVSSKSMLGSNFQPEFTDFFQLCAYRWILPVEIRLFWCKEMQIVLFAFRMPAPRTTAKF